jgi:hypothetical protein
MRRQNLSLALPLLAPQFCGLLKITGSNNAVAKEIVGHSSDSVNDASAQLPIQTLATAVAQLPEATP